MSLRVQTTPDVTTLGTSWANSQGSKRVSEVEREVSGRELNVKQAQAKPESTEETIQEAVDVESAVESINGAIEHINRGLRFSVHEDTQRMMVKVVDILTEEVIKEIPSEAVLDTAARIREMIGILIDERA